MAVTRTKAKYFTAGALGAMILILVFQNSGNTRLDFLFWDFTLPKLVLILVTFLVGVFVGKVLFRRR